jgi:hypothetical protein
LVKHVLLEIFYAGMEYDFRVLSAKVNRVELEAARLPDKIQRAFFPGKPMLPD